MTDWHKRRYGDPCRACGFQWPDNLVAGIRIVEDAPVTYAAVVADRDPTIRHPDLGWSPGAYVCHVTDNLRIWAERLAGAALGGPNAVAHYDDDLLATARCYDRIPIQGALWSLTHAVRDWVEAVGLADAAASTLLHPQRGVLGVFEVVSGNAHEVHHHRWDMGRSF